MPLISMTNNCCLIHRAMSSTSMPRWGEWMAGDDVVNLNPRMLSCHSKHHTAAADNI